ncbi:MAG: RNA helicase, partial [Bacteroidetes bacterium]|nr:RNA helicase [Bacteroidota bacterium]
DWMGFDKSLGAIESNGYTYFNIGAERHAEDWQILSPVKGFGYGTKELNRLVQKHFKKRVIDLAINPGTFIDKNGTERRAARKIAKPRGIDEIVYGDKVINTRNVKWNNWWDKIYPKDEKENSLQYIANGEIGIITGVFSSKWKDEHPTNIAFSSQEGYAYVMYSTHFKEDSIVQIELGYSITIHKSQGSDFKVVFLILPNPC